MRVLLCCGKGVLCKVEFLGRSPNCLSLKPEAMQSVQYNIIVTNTSSSSRRLASHTFRYTNIYSKATLPTLSSAAPASGPGRLVFRSLFAAVCRLVELSRHNSRSSPV